MEYLLASIFTSGLLVIIFRLFKTFQIKLFQAIVVNYFVCFLVGSITYGQNPIPDNFWTYNWFPYSLILGLLFVSTFFILGKTVQVFGLTIASVAQKMSLIISVPIAIWLYSETISAPKTLGITLAILATIFTNIPQKTTKKEDNLSKKNLVFLLPLFTWLLSGIIDILLQYVETNVKADNSYSFVTSLFLSAGVFGGIVFFYQLILKKTKLHLPSIIGGIALGIPNFFSIYFLLKLFNLGWEGSVVYPINNVGIILFASLSGLVIFKEKLSLINYIGVFCALIAIIIIGFWI